MAIRKQALLLFTKPPIPGLVKTRLTREHGGIFSNEQAAEFFRRSLYDVTELCVQALFELESGNEAARKEDPSVDEIRYDLVVSTTPASSLEAIKAFYDEIGPWPREIIYILDSGATFDDHFDDAFKQLFDRGYESVVSVGGDVPTMPRTHIVQAFQWLEYFQSLGTPGFVQAPCQECGTSLVGFSHDTPINHQGVYYNMNGVAALDSYVEKLREKDIPSAFLSPVADVDNGQDLAHTVSCLRAIEVASHAQTDLYVARRVLDWVDYLGIRAMTPPNDEHDPRQYIDE